MSCGLLQIPSLWRILIVALLSLQCRSSDPASDNASTRKGEALVNSIGKVLPLDAAPLHQQILRHMLPEPRTLDMSINNHDAVGSLTIYDPLLKMNSSHELIPAAAARWGPAQSPICRNSFPVRGTNGCWPCTYDGCK